MTTVARILQARFSSQESIDFLDLLARCLFHLGDDEAGCIVFEQTVSMKTGTIYHTAVCNSCDDQIGILGNRYVCGECADCDFCERCVVEGLIINSAFSGCTQHRLIKIPLDENACLIPGVVNDQGHTFESWLRQVLTKYSYELGKARSENH